MLDWNLKATWDLAYSAGEGPYKIPGYWRYYQYVHSNGARRKVAAIVDRLGLTGGSTVAIIGGVGYLQEELVRVLPGISMATTNISTWIQSAKASP